MNEIQTVLVGLLSVAIRSKKTDVSSNEATGEFVIIKGEKRWRIPTVLFFECSSVDYIDTVVFFQVSMSDLSLKLTLLLILHAYHIFKRLVQLRAQTLDRHLTYRLHSTPAQATYLYIFRNLPSQDAQQFGV